MNPLLILGLVIGLAGWAMGAKEKKAESKEKKPALEVVNNGNENIPSSDSRTDNGGTNGNDSTPKPVAEKVIPEPVETLDLSSIEKE